MVYLNNGGNTMTVTAKAATTLGEIKDCEWVDETIKHYGISRKEFAKEVGIDYTNLSKIIQKKYRLSKKNRKKIEDWIQKQETQSDLLKKKYDSLFLEAARKMLPDNAECLL